MNEDRTYGVYWIVNNPGGKAYIGKGRVRADGTCDRWTVHMHPDETSLIAHALRKHGRDAFTFGWLVEGLTEAESLVEEQRCIAFWLTNVHRHGRTYGYNETDGGEGMSGYRHTLQTKARLAEVSRLTAKSPARAAGNERRKGEKRSDAFRQKLRDARLREHAARLGAAEGR